MTEKDKKRFVEIMSYLTLNFPDRLVDENLVRSYFNDLSTFEIDDIESAARHYVKTGKSFPFVSDLFSTLDA